jgi:hypothetical protein
MPFFDRHWLLRQAGSVGDGVDNSGAMRVPVSPRTMRTIRLCYKNLCLTLLTMQSAQIWALVLCTGSWPSRSSNHDP